MTDPTGRLHQLLGRLSRPSAQTPYSNRRVYLFGLLFVAVTVIAASVSIWELRRDWIANQMEDTNNLAVALAAQTAGTFQAIDLVLREAQALAERAEIFDPDRLRQQMASEKTHQFLVHSLHTLPQADGIALVDNNGTIVASSRTWPTPEVDISDRDYYVHWSEHDGSEPFIGMPVLNKVTGAGS